MLACVACTVLTSCRTHSAGGVNPQVAMSPDTRSETNMELVPIGERISTYSSICRVEHYSKVDSY